MAGDRPGGSGYLIVLRIHLVNQTHRASDGLVDRRDRALGGTAGLRPLLYPCDHILGFDIECIDRPGDLVCSFAGIARKRLHLVRDHGKGPTCLTGPHGLDCGVQSENIGGLRYLIDVAR